MLCVELGESGLLSCSENYVIIFVLVKLLVRWNGNVFCRWKLRVDGFEYVHLTYVDEGRRG
jgi:hypothetical protein